jgi:hypothetical protein
MKSLFKLLWLICRFAFEIFLAVQLWMHSHWSVAFVCTGAIVNELIALLDDLYAATGKRKDGE